MTTGDTRENLFPLDRLRVMDLTTPLGHLCGKILGDLGADVIKVEPPAGDAGRRRTPFYMDPDGNEHSLFWLTYNNNKRGLTLDLEQDEGRELLARLAAQADVLIESYPPGYLDSIGVGYESLSKRNPGLIHTAITPFGQAGPYRDFQASDLEIQASAGILSLTGRPDGPPVRISLSQSEAWASLYGAMGTMTAHHWRQRGGKGQFVDVSAQAACVIQCVHAPLFWDYNREMATRQGEYLTGRTITGARFRSVWPCKDGFLTFILYGGPAGRKTNRELTAWMDREAMAPEFMKNMDWERFDISAMTQKQIDDIEDIIGKFFQMITKAEFMKEAVERGMLGYPVASTADILQDEQLMTRQFWTPLPVPGRDEAIRFPGPFARFSSSSCAVRRPAPGLGQHTDEILREDLGLSAGEILRLRSEGVI